MKTIKRLASLLLVLLLCLSTMTACSGTVTYKVSVKDAIGNPYTSGVIVQFLKGGKQVAMQPCDANGVATKELDSGKYTIALKFSDESADYYYEQDITVTAKENEVDVILAQKVKGEPEVLSVGADECNAYKVGVGCTYVTLTANSRNYFLFTPTQAGNYEFSVIGDGKTEIGYYGAPHFVQTASAAEVVDGKFSISISASMIGSETTGTASYVIGVDSLDDATTSCTVSINRVGDPVKSVVDEPWTIYETTATLAEYKLPAGATIKEFDLTASTDTYKFVYNESDGFYHLDSANGPLVLVRLAENSKYIDAFKTMLDRSGVVKYFFDENKNLIKKESYSECLLEYIEYVDSSEGVYPLTEDLKYIIQQRGDYAQWWDYDSVNFRFKDADGNNLPGINEEIAWLLMCCYIG